MKTLLAAVVVIEFVVILWLAIGGSAPPPVAPVPTGNEAVEQPDPAPPPTVEGEAPETAENAEPGPADEGTLLYGTLRADDGTTVTTGWISFVDAEAKSESARPDARGLWAKTGVAPGTYRVKVQAEGFEPLERELVVVPGGPQRVDLVVYRAALVTIHFVTPDGEPLLKALAGASKETGLTAFGVSGGLTAVATREPPPSRLPLTLLRTYTRYGTGEFKPTSFRLNPGQEDPGNGNLTVRGALPVYVSACLRSEVITTVRLTEPAERLDLVIDPAAIPGLMSGVTFLLELEGTTELPEQITADLSDRQSGGFNKVDVVDGRVTLRGSVPGAMQLTVWGGKGHERYLKNLDLPPGRILDLGTLRLRQTMKQAVRVIDAEGKPVARARLLLKDRDRGWWEQSGDSFALYADQEGHATLPLAAGRYWVYATTRDGGGGVVDLDTTAGPRPEATIRLDEQGEARIEFPDSVPVGTQARAEDAAGRPLWGLTIRMPWTYTVNLPPGPYSLILTRPDGTESRTPFHVEIGTPANITAR